MSALEIPVKMERSLSKAVFVKLLFVQITIWYLKILSVLRYNVETLGEKLLLRKEIAESAQIILLQSVHMSVDPPNAVAARRLKKTVLAQIAKRALSNQ
jgi:hypothetical protein